MRLDKINERIVERYKCGKASPSIWVLMLCSVDLRGYAILYELSLNVRSRLRNIHNLLTKYEHFDMLNNVGLCPYRFIASLADYVDKQTIGNEFFTKNATVDFDFDCGDKNKLLKFYEDACHHILDSIGLYYD